MKSGQSLIELIRGFHRDCDGCPVEQLCDEYELALNGNAVLLTSKQSAEVRDFLGRIVDDSAIFSAAHDIYDDAYVLLPWFPSSAQPVAEEAGKPREEKG